MSVKDLRGYRLRPTTQMMMPWHPGITVSTERAAEILGCCRMTVVRLIEDGTLNGYRMRPKNPNSRYRVLYDSVIEVSHEYRKQMGIEIDDDLESAQIAPSAPNMSRMKTRRP